MSLDMCLYAVAGETERSDLSASMAVGLSDPLGGCGAADPARDSRLRCASLGRPVFQAVRS
jgi:hypothetical protein